MKLLLLTDVPPCTNYTAGLVLNQLCQFVPPGSLACFTAMNGGLQPEWDPKLDWMPRRVVFKPGEFGLAPPRRRRLMRVAGMLREYGRRAVKVPPLIDKAVAFGREQKVDAVWAVLQGQTMVRMARRVASRLGVPLYTQVWDPLSWWLQAHLVDPLNRRAATAEFHATMRASVACAAASPQMAEAYATQYGVRSVPVIASLDPTIARPPASAPRNRTEITIGMAGQFYAGEEWRRLIDALNHAGWRVSDREVRLKVFGREPPEGAIPEDRLIFTGFIPQSDLVRALADETDIVYCPYPFDVRMSEVAHLSFPSKLPIYFASGRPVLFHGPAYSAPYKYLSAREAASCSRSNEPAALYNALERLVRDQRFYHRTAAAGSAAFYADFTLERMQRAFFDFLGIPGAGAFTDPSFSIAQAARTSASRRDANATTGQAGGDTMTEVEELRARAAALQRDVAAAKAAEDAVWQEVAALRIQHMAERDELEHKLAALKAAPEALDEATRAYVLSADLKRAQEANARLLDELERARAGDGDSAGAVQAYDREVSSQVVALQAELTAMRAREAEVAGWVEALEAELAIVRARAADADEQVCALEADISAVRSREADASSRADIAEADLAAARAREADASGRADIAEADLAAARAREADTAKHVFALQADLSAMRAREAEATKQVAALQADMASVSETASRLSHELVIQTAKAGDTEAMRARIDELKDQIAALRTESAVAAVRLSVQEEIAALRIRADNAAAHTELAHASRRASEAEQAATRANDERAAHQRAHVEEVRAGIEFLSGQLAESREVKAAEGRLVGRLSMLASDLSELKRDMLRPGGTDSDQAARLRTLYLDLLEASVCGRTSSDPNMDRWSPASFDADRRLLGRDWPRSAQTMIGQVRLRNIRTIVERVIEDKVPGDLLEAGVWRGGACIYMRGILYAYGERNRKVWVADSFEGLPPPDTVRYPQDAGDEHHVYDELQASAEDVKRNFEAYGLLDDQVRFLEGWFKDTLPAAPVKQLAVLRLDGDMYGSTIETLEAMYHRVSPGGFVIVDDYILKPCREAIEDFRSKQNISDAIEQVDGAAVFWRKGGVSTKSAQAITAAERSGRKNGDKSSLAAE